MRAAAEAQQLARLRDRVCVEVEAVEQQPAEAEAAPESASEPAQGDAKNSTKDSAQQLLTGMSVLDVTTKLRMNPMHYRKAGAVIGAVLAEGYTETQANTICRALFLNEQKDMYTAWRVFAGSKDTMGPEEFRKIVPLLGPAQEGGDISALYKIVDSNGDGVVDFKEFCVLLEAINKSTTTPGDQDKPKNALFGFVSGFGF